MQLMSEVFLVTVLNEINSFLNGVVSYCTLNIIIINHDNHWSS